MNENKILDAALIKDLSNHIYEKRKATAFQIEGLTKSAFQRNDSETISKIITELTDLIDGGSSSAKMGAITALGSVSIALGSFAIAFFLNDIIKPIFATFNDTDARVRYYACESLYNIAKIARGEILSYFNEIFDILCILVTDTVSSVKNAADILDRLIKDIVSAKSTNYVSILQQQEHANNEIKSNVVDSQGVAIQVNQIQDVQKAFSLPRFIPTLLERMYTTDPFAKKFLIGWMELFDDIPSLELITFVPNLLEPLIKFLMNKCPSDVRIETQNLLNNFLKEIKAISKVKFEVKKRQMISELEKKHEKAKHQSQEEAESSPTPEDLSEDIKDIELKAGDEHSIKSNDTTLIRKNENNDEAIVDSDSYSDDGSIFLSGQDIFIDFPKIFDILLSFLRVPGENPNVKVNDLSLESHETYTEIELTVIKWLQEILLMSPTSFVKYLPDCISVTLKNISITDNNKDFDLRNQLLKFNISLQDFIINLNERGDSEGKSSHDEVVSNKDDIVINVNEIHGLNKEVYEEFLEVYLNKTFRGIMHECLTCANELARLTLIDWLIFLYSKIPSSFLKVISNEEKSPESKDSFDFTALLKSSADASNEVILKVLHFLSQISETNQDFFKEFMIKLVKFVESEGSVAASSLSRSKIEFIIRKLCVTLSSEKIYKSISEVLALYETEKLEFLNMMVVTLNNILLTSHELAGFRKKLKNLDVYKLEDWSLFATLFQSWCHSPPSALSLCLFTSNYELAYLIIKNLADLEVTFQLLTQLDVLVQLLETPIFLKLRLQLLEPEKNPHLYKTLYGILMILPQSTTFTTLKNRLSSISLVNNTNNPGLTGPLSTPVTTPGANTTPNNQLSIKKKRNYEMIEKFSTIREAHDNYHLEGKLKDSYYNGFIPPARSDTQHQLTN